MHCCKFGAYMQVISRVNGFHLKKYHTPNNSTDFESPDWFSQRRQMTLSPMVIIIAA
jgi:hypothetical protein